MRTVPLIISVYPIRVRSADAEGSFAVVRAIGRAYARRDGGSIAVGDVVHGTKEDALGTSAEVSTRCTLAPPDARAPAATTLRSDCRRNVMMRGIAFILAVGLVILGLAGFSQHATAWLTWLDVVAALCAFALAFGIGA